MGLLVNDELSAAFSNTQEGKMNITGQICCMRFRQRRNTDPPKEMYSVHFPTIIGGIVESALTVLLATACYTCLCLYCILAQHTNPKHVFPEISHIHEHRSIYVHISLHRAALFNILLLTVPL